MYEKEVIDNRERDDRGDGDGESSVDGLECAEGDDASDARSTSSSGVDMLITRERGLQMEYSVVGHRCCIVRDLQERSSRWKWG